MEKEKNKSKIKEYYHKHNFIINIIILIIVFITIPLIIDCWIIGNDIPSNISNEDWVSFLGSYIGAVATIIGIWWTIRFTREQAEKDREHAKQQADEDRRYQLRPYLHIKSINILETDADAESLHFSIHDNHNTDLPVCLRIKNLGLGPALDIHIFNICYEDNNNTKTAYSIHELDKGDEKDYIFELYVRHVGLEKERVANFSFSLFYSDMDGNNYKEDINMGLYYILRLNSDSDTTIYFVDDMKAFVESTSFTEKIPENFMQYFTKYNMHA